MPMDLTGGSKQLAEVHGQLSAAGLDPALGRYRIQSGQKLTGLVDGDLQTYLLGSKIKSQMQ